MILDLFAGCGGWSEGLRAIGLGDVGLEWDRDACSTRAAAGHKTVRADVSRYPVEPFVGKVRGLIASPPCQAFSMAGNRLGMLDLGRIHAAVEAARSGWRDELREGEWSDPRSALILEPLRWTWALKPEWVACEQVPPAVPVWEHMASVLRSWGYDATAVRLLAADYGVPQTRLRAFLLAHRTRVNVPAPTHAKDPHADLFGGQLQPWVSMASALGWMPGGMAIDRRLGFAGDEPVTDDRPAPTLSLSHLREVWRLRGNNSVAGEGRAERAADEPALTVGSRADLWTLVQNNRPHGAARDADQPAPVLYFGARLNWVGWRPATSVQGDPRIGRPGHKDRDLGESQFEVGSVHIELHEAAVLQSFPANYPFRGTKTSRFRQAGDAVPPVMAAAVIGALAT